MDAITLILPFAAVTLALVTRCSHATETTLSAGAAVSDITPDPAMTNWVDQEPYDGIVDPLDVRTLVLDDGDTSVAFVCWDLIDVTDEALRSVREAVGGATGIPTDHILVGASHTHSAPRSPFTSEGSVTPWQSERRRAIMEDPVFRDWSGRLPAICAETAKVAQDRAQPVRLAIGRADAGEWLFNRRPMDADGNVVTTFSPDDSLCLPDGLRFRLFDYTLTVLTLRTPEETTVASLFSVPCHAVSVYPHHQGISADWPGPACDHIAAEMGGEALYLQGCAGDIVPARRGLDARDEMARFFADRAVAAARQAGPLPSSPLQVTSFTLALPVTVGTREKGGPPTRDAEVQVIACGPLALVALPGEPLTGLAREIRRRSPLPHTVVVGYANGRGVGYVGLSGEKARGGYEARAGSGTDECGPFLIETAVRLLEEICGARDSNPSEGNS